jgi:hypothetical protein
MSTHFGLQFTSKDKEVGKLDKNKLLWKMGEV